MNETVYIANCIYSFAEGANNISTKNVIKRSKSVN